MPHPATECDASEMLLPEAVGHSRCDFPVPALALSCSAAGVSAALVLEGAGQSATIECWHEATGSGRSDSLLATIDTLLRANQLQPLALRHVVVDVGPGPFTALRVACSVAQGICLATGASADTVWATEALALQAVAGRGPGSHTVLVVIDARMGEVYAATLEVELDRNHRLIRLTESRPCIVVNPSGVWDGAGPGHAQGDRASLLIAGNALAALPDFADALTQSAQAHGWSVERARGALSVRGDAAVQVSMLRSQTRTSWQGEYASVLTPRYVRNKVALDVSEQAAARARADGGVR